MFELFKQQVCGKYLAWRYRVVINVLHVITIIKHVHELFKHRHIIFADFRFCLWDPAHFFRFKGHIWVGRSKTQYVARTQSLYRLLLQRQ